MFWWLRPLCPWTLTWLPENQYVSSTFHNKPTRYSLWQQAKSFSSNDSYKVFIFNVTLTLKIWSYDLKISLDHPYDCHQWKWSQFLQLMILRWLLVYLLRSMICSHFSVLDHTMKLNEWQLLCLACDIQKCPRPLGYICTGHRWLTEKENLTDTRQPR